jgi:hypothetical protein
MGEVLNPSPVVTAGPKITINRKTSHGVNASDTPEEISTESDAEGEDSEDEDGDEDVEAIIRSEEPERTDIPDYMCEAGEKSTRDADYVFCPAVHRAQGLRLFRRHLCRHPFFPERNRSHSKAEKIWRECVLKMYRFCKERDLREVWGYMWNSRYCPKMWPLWAHSRDPDHLSRLWTTMTAENTWKRIKHTHLHNLVHPRLDQLVHILIYEVTPAIDARIVYLDPTFRWGRAREETTWQKGFHATWNAMLKKPLSGKKYVTNVKRWTCSCGQQPYNTYHLCKHLVDAVGMPSNKFWVEIYRRRTMPIYRHPELHPIGEEIGSYDDVDEGGISEGDDVVWSGDKTVLSSGLWRDVGRDSLLGKRVREEGDNTASGRHGAGDSSQTPRLDGQDDAPAAFGDPHSEDEDEVVSKVLS